MGRQAVMRGRKLGDRYVRVEISQHAAEFRARGAGAVEATERVLQPRSWYGRAYASTKRVLLGRRLATEMEAQERLTKVKALAVLSSDAISSVAYATEASLGVLIAASVGALQINPLIALAIALLMVIVGTSYFQTIHAYSGGGGSYIVARDNLGDLPGLIAAAALLIDYVLTVSVSVSSGVDAFVSAVTPLAPYDVPLGVICIVLIMVINLRGIRESGTIFAAPTYLFIVSFLIMIGAGIFYAATHGGGLLGAVHPSGTPAQYGWGDLHQRLGLLLVLTAFASGCSAMTGVEAISNGIPAFKAPEAHNAARTLIWMIGVLVTLFLGVTYLAWRFGIVPHANQQPTVDSQIAALVFQQGYSPFGFMYYVVQFTTLLILVLAANTSFADFPRLSSILARDGYLPHLFRLRGDRLAFTTGIVVLGALSIVLLVGFKGSTEALINLYALGVFTAFTLSQAGMVLHWRRLRERAGPGWRRSMVINTVGAITTGLVAVIITITKFDRGAWIVVILVPLLVLMFRGISKHYVRVQAETQPLTPLHAAQLQHIAVVPVAELNKPALQALAYVRSLTSEVIALHVATSEDEERKLREEWDRWVESRKDVWQRQGMPVPQLVVIESPYRSLVSPLVAYIDALRDENPDATVSVVLPEFVTAHLWERLLHNQTALRLKFALYSRPGVVVINVPYHLKP
jgi:amino acid transporter